MQTPDIKKELDLLTEMAISNVDFHFHNYVLEDILECGQVEYIIDNQSWLLYWVDISERLNNLMNKLIIDYLNGVKDHYSDLQECTRIKTIIDKKLIENPEFDTNEVFDFLGFELNKNQNSKLINVAGSNESKSSIINNLYHLLSDKGYIEIEINEFNLHFKDSSDSLHKIKWLGTEVQLVGLFNKLIEKKVIPRFYQFNYLKLITYHFVNKNGKAFNEKQLSVSRSKLLNIELFEEIVCIVNELAINRN